jgi:hypothetical protein
MKFDQATGLCGGMLVRRGLKSPSAMSFAKFGIFPFWRNSSRREGSMPSMPSMRTFFDTGIGRAELQEK